MTAEVSAALTRAGRAYIAIGEADPTADRLPDVVVQHFTQDMPLLAAELCRLEADLGEVSSVLDAMTPMAQSLRRQVEAARAFAAEMAGYCSPHGVSVTYAQRLIALMDGAA